VLNVKDLTPLKPLLMGGFFYIWVTVWVICLLSNPSKEKIDPERTAAKELAIRR
jgi:hypothetical protein